MESKIIEKYVAPCRLDHAQTGQLWKVLEEESALYIQLSHDEKNPRWERLGTVLEMIYTDEFPYSSMNIVSKFHSLKEKKYSEIE